MVSRLGSEENLQGHQTRPESCTGSRGSRKYSARLCNLPFSLSPPLPHPARKEAFRRHCHGREKLALSERCCRVPASPEEGDRANLFRRRRPWKPDPRCLAPTRPKPRSCNSLRYAGSCRRAMSNHCVSIERPNAVERRRRNVGKMKRAFGRSSGGVRPVGVLPVFDELPAKLVAVGP